MLPKQPDGAACNFVCRIGRNTQRSLTAEGVQRHVPYRKRQSARLQTVIAESECDHLGQRHNNALCVAGIGNVFGRRRSVADADGLVPLGIAFDGISVGSGCIGVHFFADLAEMSDQQFGGRRSEIADGINVHFVEFALGRSPDKQHFAHIQRICNFFHVLTVDHSDGIGLFKIAAEFGKHLAERYADRNRQSARFFLNAASDGVGNFCAAAKKLEASRNVKPTFVQPEALHFGGKLCINIVNFAGICGIRSICRRYDDQIGTLLLCLPDRFSRLDAADFGGLTFGKHDAVPLFGIAAYGNGLPLQLGVQQRFDRSVKIVKITVQNDPIFHNASTTRLPVYKRHSRLRH